MNLLENVPNFICFKAAACNENSFLKSLELEKDSIAIFDKGFNKYSYFSELTQEDIGLVTRLKDNAKYEVLANNNVSDELDVVSDQCIELKIQSVEGYSDSWTSIGSIQRPDYKRNNTFSHKPEEP